MPALNAISDPKHSRPNTLEVAAVKVVEQGVVVVDDAGGVWAVAKAVDGQHLFFNQLKVALGYLRVVCVVVSVSDAGCFLNGTMLFEVFRLHPGCPAGRIAQDIPGRIPKDTAVSEQTVGAPVVRVADGLAGINQAIKVFLKAVDVNKDGFAVLKDADIILNERGVVRLNRPAVAVSLYINIIKLGVEIPHIRFVQAGG